MFQKRFHTYLYGCDGCFQFVIDIVGKLFFYPFLLLLFVECGIMFPVTVNVSLLQAGIDTDDII